MNYLVFLISAGLTVYYFTQVLLYSDAPQPFESRHATVIRTISTDRELGTTVETSHSVGLFDRVRRVFGLYIVLNNIWQVRSDKVAVWMCPKCLGWWVSVVVCMIVAWMYSDITALAWVAPLAGLNWFLTQITDKCSD